MPFTLDTFTKQVPPALLKQAQAHIADGQVHNLEQLEGEWVAEVADGEQSYAVAVVVGPKRELLATCTCGDLEHDLCRHAVATLLAAGAQAQQAAPARRKPGPKPTGAKTPNKNTVAGRMREALNAAPHAALVELLIKISTRDKPMQNLIMMEVADVGESLESYRDAVKAALSPRGGRDAWFDARTLRTVEQQMRTLLERAEQSLTAGDVDKSLMMAVIVLEELARATDRVGFSEFFEVPSTSATRMIAQNFKRLSREGRTGLFKALIRIGQLPPGLVNNPLEFRGLLVEMVESPAERALVEPLLIAPKSSTILFSSFGPDRNDPFWSFDGNRYMSLQRRLIERLDGPEASLEFSRRNLAYGDLRIFLIEDAIKRQEWAQVEELAREGVRLATERSLHGLAPTYREYLIKATDALGGASPTTLRDQFLATQKPAAYARWKASVPPDQWAIARANLLAASRLPSETMCEILASEEAWRDLMDWLLRFVVNISEIRAILEDSALKLVELYPDDVARLCTRGIETVLDKYQTSRHDYRAVAAMLNQMKSLGLVSQAREEAELLREFYPKRKTLLEEIAGI